MGTILPWLALLISIGALGYAWRLQQEIAQAKRRLDRYNRSLFDANDEIRRLREELADTVAELRVEALRPGIGTLAFTPKMTVRETLMVHPQAEQILAGFHLGGCSSCAVEPDETLAQICRDQGRDLTELLRNLNLLLTIEADNNGQRIRPIKIPNVEFALDG